MDRKANEKQLDIDLGLTLDCHNEVLVRRFITNDWSATLLMDVLDTVCVKIKNFYGSQQHPDNILDEADRFFNNLVEKCPDCWDESQRSSFRLEFILQRYNELYQMIDILQCEITKLRDEKCIDD